ncbi:PREDICTED: uncharacterized protein LOC105453374 isoform X2 [Wasmannia auropunctata]|uniref:uncharacterized protein LOC105453374 isoform X2 n=1 Tax=Wasmannia auropunctata TaxID=64793 RepID=UPI0005EF9139|nr:PREDICTED: uncharacterized protein LOC105453374 isoform X2 [Wasmannia auropunctata]
MITKYLCCTLACMCLLKVANTEISRDKNSLLQFERQLLNALNAEKTIKSKRPFCNAFTGCGRFISEERRVKKKGPSTQLRDLPDVEVTSDNVQLPISLYRALLNAAKQNVWKTTDRETYDYRLQQIPRIYLSGQMPLRDMMES